MNFQLRPYQIDGLNAIWNYFASGKTGHPILAWPTGTGKSIVPAEFIRTTMRTFLNQKFLMITHVKELIEQNAEKLLEVWPNAPLGIYSAGLKSKDFIFPIIFGGIQSMIKNPVIFGRRDIIFIDECHLVSQDDNSMYLNFIAAMKLINPYVKVIGLSATPFRMGQGYITDGGLFTDIVHDLTSLSEFNQLIIDGYLAPLVPKRTQTQIDVSNVRMAKGEFVGSQLEAAADKIEITKGAIGEMLQYGQNRRSWLIFASGIDHAEHIASELGRNGIDCAPVHSKQTTYGRNEDYNTAAIKAFKANQLRSIVCYSKLTTGFNHPHIDMIADIRPTMSIPLHVQKLGRGTRPADEKENCLVLDFGRNVPRLGPINDPVIPRKKGEKTGDIPIKLCDACGAYNHISARKCCDCGQEFKFEVKITAQASTDEIIKSDYPIIETFDVIKVYYSHREGKENKPPYLKVTYIVGMQSFNENVFPEHGGYATKLFHDWWMQRHPSEPPATVNDVIKMQNELRMPRQIKVWTNKRFPEVRQAVW